MAGAATFGLTVGLIGAFNADGGLGKEGSRSRAVAASLGLAREHLPQPGAYYSGCREARAAGVAPLYAGEPGYREEMDGDSDGIACEPHRGIR